MELLEVVAQGLRGFPDLTRVAFGAGVSVLHPLDGREQILTRILLELLYPKGSEPQLADLALEGQDKARVGLLVVGRDGGQYRLLEEVTTGRRSLMKRAADGFQPMTGAAAEIAQAVTAQIGFPQEDVLKGLFVARRADLPSQRRDVPKVAPPAARGGSGPQRAAPPGFGDDKPLPPGFGPSGDGAALEERSLRDRLTIIEGHLAQTQRVRELEFEIDGLQKRVFELDAKLAPITTKRRAAAEAERDLEKYVHLASIPDDLPARGKRFKELEDEQARELKRFEADRRALAHRIGMGDDEEVSSARRRAPHIKPMTLAFADPLVRYGVLGGVAAIALAVVGGMQVDALRWVALLDIPAFGVAVWGALRVIADLEETATVRRRLKALDAEMLRIRGTLEIDAGQLKSLLQRHALTMEQLPALADQMERRADAMKEVDAMHAAAAALTTPEMLAVEAEKTQVLAQAKALEEQLQSTSSYLPPVADLEREKREITRALSPTSAAQGDEDDYRDEAPQVAYVEDLTPQLVRLGADALVLPVSAVVEAIKGRLAQVLAGLSEQRFVDARFGGRGELFVVEASSGQSLPFPGLTPGDRDIVWLALRLTLAEAYARRERIPLVFERALDLLPPQKEGLLVRILQFLGGLTQVVTMTERGGIAAAAQHRVVLP